MKIRSTLLATTMLALCAEAAQAQDRAAQSPSSLSQIVVTASPVAGDPDRFATIVERVDRDAIAIQGGANLADALRTTPGVAGTGFAAGASRPVIRGMDAQRVRIVENGLSSSDVSDVGPDHGVPIDPLASQSIEVVRGAATLRYGSQAIGGVVNALNNRIPLHRASRAAVDSLAAYNSVSDSREGAVALDDGQGPFAVHLDGFYRHADDYDTPLGKQANSFFRGGGFSGGASYFFGGDSRIGASGTHYEARYGIPGEDTFIKMRQNKGAFGSSFKLNSGALQSLNIDASYADYSHSEIDPAGPTVESTFNNKEWDGRAEALFGAMGPLSGAALGVQLQDRKFEGLGEGADYLLPTHTQSVAGFGFVEAPVGAVHLQGALRVETVDIDGTPISGARTNRDFTPVSVSAGLSYEASSAVRLGLTATSAARAPAQTELFARGPHDGPQTFETGDPTLRIERSNSLEATLRLGVRKTGRIEAAVWGARFDNYIYGQLTGRTCDDEGACDTGGEGELKELDYSQRDAQFWGAELKANVPVLHASGGALSVDALADYVRAKFTGGGGNVPRIQPGRIGGGLSWSSDALDAGFLVLGVSRQSKVGPTETATPGYVSVDAQIAWRPFRQARGVEFLLVGHNLADETIRNATALNRDEVVMPGRDIRLALRAKF